MRRYHHRIPFAHASRDPMTDRGEVQPLRRGPVADRFPNSVNFDPVIPARIVGLLFPRGPSNIARLITATVFNSFDAVLCARTFSEMVIKYLKTVPPFRTDINPPTAVIFE